MARVLVDTGFLVALGRGADPLHDAAAKFLRRHTGGLFTVSPVIVEACFFLNVRAKIALLDLVQSDILKTVEIPGIAYREISAVIDKYADRDIDFADAALVWLADLMAVRHILTVDHTDFGIYRLKGGRRFEILKWFD